MKSGTRIFIVLIVCICIASCAKKGALEDSNTRIVGTWKLVQTATDDNNNNLLDQSELRTVDSGYSDKLRFNTDGTGAEEVGVNDTTSDYLFNYYLIGLDSMIRTFSTGDDISSHFETLTNASMTLKNSTTPVVSWYLYKKV